MLGEIHEWYTNHLKYSRAGPTSSAPSLETSHPIPEAGPSMTFEVYAEVPGRVETDLICPRASFCPDWLATKNHGCSFGLFQCHCRSDGGLQRLKDGTADGIHTASLQFTRKTSRESIPFLKVKIND
jgi:hypothetical protein